MIYNVSISSNNCSVIIEPGNIELKYQEDSFKFKWQIRGTPLNEEFYQNIIFPSQEMAFKLDTLQLMQKNGAFNMENTKEISLRMASLVNIFYENNLKFIKKHINNSVGEYLLLTLGFLKDEDIAEIQPKLSNEVRNKLDVRMALIKQSVKSMGEFSFPNSQSTESENGKLYTDFEGENTDGFFIRFSDLIKDKKLVLIDFWASWCTPCLRKIPHLKEIFTQNQDRGLIIISISIDEDRNMWKKVVENLNLEWPQLLDSSQKKKIKETYGINLIPHTILIDAHGVIISRGLRGKDLEDKIEEILK